MIPLNRPARIAAAVGATVAAGATAMLAVTATASADEPGRCLQNVNVREKPDAESRIVALCEAGTKVELGEERDGFVRIDELGGWASKDYVKADETSSSDDRSGGSSSDDERSEGGSHGGSHGDSGRHSSDDDDHGSSTGGSSSGEDGEPDEAMGGDSTQLDGLLS
jgi:SH3 domain-containing protein